MSRNVELHLGINGGFCAGRWEQPENWIRLTAELGFACHELDTDVLDPLFSGDRQYQIEEARRLRAAAQNHDIRISGVCAGMATRRFHGISHSHPIVRQQMTEWMVSAMEIATEVGADRIGGRFDTFPTEIVEKGEDARKQAVKRQHEALRDLARVGRDKGLGAIYVEQSDSPAQCPWTIRQAEELLLQVNRNAQGCKVSISVDVGRTRGNRHGLEGRELDYAEWLRALAPFAGVVHLQQTTADGCDGWPFTDAFNERGCIEMERVIEAIREGHAGHEDSWVSEVMEPVSETFLIVRTAPVDGLPESQVLDGLKQSADYLGKWLPGGHAQLTI